MKHFIIAVSLMTFSLLANAQTKITAIQLKSDVQKLIGGVFSPDLGTGPETYDSVKFRVTANGKACNKIIKESYTGINFSAEKFANNFLASLLELTSINDLNGSIAIARIVEKQAELALTKLPGKKQSTEKQWSFNERLLTKTNEVKVFLNAHTSHQ